MPYIGVLTKVFIIAVVLAFAHGVAIILQAILQ